MWGCAENNDTKQGKVNSQLLNSQLYPWCPTFKYNLIWPSMKKLLNLPLFYGVHAS